MRSSLLGLSNSGKVSRRDRRSWKLGSAHGSEDFEEPEELMGREVREAEYHDFGSDYNATRRLELWRSVCEEGEELH